MSNPNQSDRNGLKSKEGQPTKWLTLTEFFEHFGKIGENIKIKAPKTKDGTDATSNTRMAKESDSNAVS